MLKTDFPEITHKLKEMNIEGDWGLDIATLMYLKEGNKAEIQNVLEKSFNMGEFERIIFELSIWLSRKLKMKNLDMEEQIAKNIVELLENDSRIKILLQKAIIAQRYMKIVDNIQIDYKKNRYK